MALIKTIKDVKPSIGMNVYLSESATVIGDVSIGDNSSIWFNTVIRGDVNKIFIGSCTNIQDGTVVHGTYKKNKVIIGNNVSIGHNSIIHACRIEDNVLIGMGAIIMDGVIVSSNSIVAAGSVVLPDTKIDSGLLYAGVPAKIIKKLTDKEISESIKKTAKNYLKYSSWY